MRARGSVCIESRCAPKNQSSVWPEGRDVPVSVPGAWPWPRARVAHRHKSPPRLAEAAVAVLHQITTHGSHTPLPLPPNKACGRLQLFWYVCLAFYVFGAEAGGGGGRPPGARRPVRGTWCWGRAPASSESRSVSVLRSSGQRGPRPGRGSCGQTRCPRAGVRGFCSSIAVTKLP